MRTITHIRLSDQDAETSEKITHVWLGWPHDRAESVAQVIRRMHFENEEYYYTSSPSGESDEVIYVKPEEGDSYIKTKGNETKEDNLLNLPQF